MIQKLKILIMMKQDDNDNTELHAHVENDENLKMRKN